MKPSSKLPRPNKPSDFINFPNGINQNNFVNAPMQNPLLGSNPYGATDTPRPSQHGTQFNSPVSAEFSNFSKAYSPSVPLDVNGWDPTSGFTNKNFKNQNDIMINNLGVNVLDEHIKEYSILIDSKDRNYKAYPNPFKYKVKFGPLPSKAESVDGKFVVHTDTTPYIYNVYNNIRYIKLETVLLPYFYREKDGKVDPRFALTNHLYNLVHIDEYTDVNQNSTNDVLMSSFGICYYDYRINETHFAGNPLNAIKIFPPDKLATLKSLSLSITDPNGKVYDPVHLDKSLETGRECLCEEDEEYEDECYIHSIKHPLNPIFQNHFHFKIGVVEPNFNKKVFY